MENIDKVYHNLTGVDIATQKRLWDERGKGYYGEYLVFRKLYPNLSGCCKILMNAEIPTGDGRTTEIDLLLIHETGLYVFEMKHYKGTIYGKAFEPKWTQYFRTAPNSHFYNPVLQNQHHIKALQNIFPNIPVHSLIVFTSPACALRVECNGSNIAVCRLENLYAILQHWTSRNAIMDIDQIDEVFNKLVPFSPVATKTATVDGEAVLFHQYINTMVKDFCDERENVKKTYLAAEKTERKKTRITIAIAAMATAISIAASVFACTRYRKYADGQIAAAEQELSAFAQKFEHVAPYSNGNVTLKDDFITASNVQLSESVDVKNAVNLGFTLDWNGENYGANISRDTKIIVILKDGTVKEYDLLESIFPHASKTLALGKDSAMYKRYTTYEFPVHELSDLKLEDISYIKLSGLDIWVAEAERSKAVVGTGYEVKIY